MESKKQICSITLNLFTSNEINKNLAIVSKKLKKADSMQEKYPEKSYHCTIKGIANFQGKPNKKIISDYIKKVDLIIDKIKSFEIEVKNISNFPNVVIAKAYSKDKKLQKYHNLFCKTLPGQFPEFEKKNYIPHITMMHIVSDSKKLLEEVKKYKNQDFGKMIIKEIQLVSYYPSFSGKYKIIKRYKLK
ncbi:MAG: hypothetical protein WCX82_01105 [archaeon]|jgi:2'-5' RNA ligase